MIYHFLMSRIHLNTVRFKMIASSYAFFVRDGKILLSRRKNTGYKDGMYSLPAGHVEDGETLTDCLIREAREEVGVMILPRNITLVHTMHRKETDIRLDFFFYVHQWSGKLVNCEPNKCDDLCWSPMDLLPNNTIQYIQTAIACWQKGIIYQEFGW